MRERSRLPGANPNEDKCQGRDALIGRQDKASMDKVAKTAKESKTRRFSRVRSVGGNGGRGVRRSVRAKNVNLGLTVINTKALDRYSDT